MALTAGSVIRIEDQWEGTVVEGQDGPGSKVMVRLLEGQTVPIDPAVVKIEVIEAAADETHTNKEDVTMINTTHTTTAPLYTVEEIRSTALTDRMLPEIHEAELLTQSNVYRQKLPSGAIVEVQFRKLTKTMGVLAVTDDLGTRHFKVMASKRNPGELYVPEKTTQTYTKNDGTTAESVVLEADRRAQAMIVAITKRIMAAEGISFGDTGGAAMLPDLSSDIPF